MEASKSVLRKNEEWPPTPRVSLRHRKVDQALDIFRNLFSKYFREYKAVADQRDYIKEKKKALMNAAMQMKEEHRWENIWKCAGHVPGVEVGDQFQYRAELLVVGLHHQFTCGIDYLGKGERSLATSIVSTKRYDNVKGSSGSLTYIGHGGNPSTGSKVIPCDQKLEGGNLALKNSMDAKSPVRVILKVCGKSDRIDVGSSNDGSNNFFFYVYDGLYLVEKCVQARGKFGKLVFKFTLNRILDQPNTCVSPKDVNNSGHFASFTQRKRLKSQKDVIRVNDISNGQEKFPIRVVTPIDCHEMPPSFDYIVSALYSQRPKLPTRCSCDCVDGFVDCEKCACIVKNGGTMPYDRNKRLASRMNLPCIYECGPCCKCSTTCINRVSQGGIQFQLEIFKTELKGWGVRTRSFIPAGSFVCEYIGEVCPYRAAGSRLHNDSYIFHLGGGNGFIDATRYGNIGRFINHSCNPNLHVKDIMYDHDDMNFPHKVLFALKDIPAGRELSYDYNCCKGRFFKVKSNSCHCGSQECNGHIYT